MIQFGRQLIAIGLLALMAVPLLADTRPVADAEAFRLEASELLTTTLRNLEVVPGIIIAVVIGDEVVLAEGYGTADRENGVPSTGETIYYIASATKPFTALTSAILDHRDVIDLDDPLSKHLHGTTLNRALTPDKVRLRDLLSHTSGINNNPIATRLAFTGEHDPATLWWLLGKSEPMEDAPLGTFRYTNVGYNIIGMILDRETEKPWQDLLRDEIFQPLGMHRTTAYASLPKREGWPQAAPYFGLHPDGIQRLYLQKTDETMQSAGGMMTTAEDLAQFLELQMNDGKVDGHQIVPASVIRRTHEKLADVDEGRPPFGQSGYGLGWSHGSWQDKTVLYHNGGFAGFFSTISFMPEAGIGVAVVTNEAAMGGRLAGAACGWAYDWWLDTPEEDRSAEAMITQFADMRSQIVERVGIDLAKRAEREWQLSRPREAYAGSYMNELYGTVDIELQEGELAVAIGNLHCISTPYTKPETMPIELVPGQGEVIAFELAEGRVERLIWDDDVFQRVKDTAATEAGYK